MAGVTPSQVAASDVNVELGVSSTATLLTQNNWVKNVAAIPNATTTVNYGKFRWGINFPGRKLAINKLSPSDNRAQYNTTNNMTLSSYGFGVGSPGGSAQGNVVIDITSAGLIRYIATTLVSGTTSTVPFVRTWLTSGTNADYTANVILTTGSFDAGSAATGSDLALSTDRRWKKSILSSGGTASAACSGQLVIKNDGVEILRRPWSISVTGEWTNL